MPSAFAGRSPARKTISSAARGACCIAGAHLQHELIDPLSTEQLWQRPYRYGNSIGNLVLHLSGNLNYYIGAQIAGTGYVRHRDQEFSDSGKPKDALLRDFDRAIEVVIGATANQSADDCHEAKSCKRKPRIGEEHAEEFFEDVTEDAH